MPLGLVRNRTAMRRGRKFATAAASPPSDCVVCCAGSCVIPCAMPAYTAETTAIFNEAFDACPGCIPKTVRITVTNMTPPANELVPVFAAKAEASEGGPIIWLKCLNPPAKFDICLDFSDVSFAFGSRKATWNRIYAPLPAPVSFEIYVDPFPSYDDDGCYIYNPGGAQLLCTTIVHHVYAFFEIVASQSTDAKDYAAFAIAPCFSFDTESIAACTQTFANGEDTVELNIASFPFGATPLFVLHGLDPADAGPSNIVDDFCGGVKTYTALDEGAARTLVAAGILSAGGSLPCYREEGGTVNYVDAYLPYLSYGGTVRVKPCCILADAESCEGDVIAEPVTWYRGRYCNGLLSPVITRPEWAELDGETAYFDGSTLRCITFSVDDTVSVDRVEFPWDQGFVPFYVPLATFESCAASPLCGGGTCPTDNSECDDTYIGTFTPAGSGGAPCGEATSKVGTLTPDGDGTWSWEQYPETQPGFYQMELYCEDGFQYAKVFDLVEEGGFSILFRKALSGGPCPPTGEYDYFSGGAAGCDLTGSTFSLA